MKTNLLNNNTEIISRFSTILQGILIGSAPPSKDELQEVQHHLFTFPYQKIIMSEILKKINPKIENYFIERIQF